MNASELVDWSGHDGFPENTVECWCGTVFRSHSTYKLHLGIVSRKSCPQCGKHVDKRAAYSDPESFTIEGG